MELKKIKKLVLNKEIISNLTENRMSYIKGGKETDDTGYGPCKCNGTVLCSGTCPTFPDPKCGANTSILDCYCA